MNLLLLLFEFKLIFLTLLLLKEINCNNNGLNSSEQFENFKENFDSLAENLLKSLRIAHKLDENEETIRQKRSVNSLKSNRISFLNKGVHRLKEMIPLFPICSQPIDFTTIEFYGQMYGICVSFSSDSSPAIVRVGPISPNGFTQNTIQWIVKEPQKVVAFVDEDKDTKERNLYVLIADSGSRDGTDVVVINKMNQIINKEQHTVHSLYPTAIAVWKSKTDNTYHLAIANSFGSDSTQTYRSQTFTYNWMQTYFDKYSSMNTYLVKDICVFNIHSNEFLAIANFKAGPHVLEVDSEIFKLDIDRNKWRTFQRIRTFGATDWEFFTFGSDKNEEYFLAVANSLDSSNGQNVFEVNSVIYKFSDDKFVPFQSLPTFGATQMKSFKGRNGEFILAVSNAHQSVRLYQYNGWHFVETHVQYTTGVMSPGVLSLHFNYLPFQTSSLLFVCNPRHAFGHVFKIDFVYENPLGEWYNNSINWCQNTDRQVISFGTNNLNALFNDVFYVDQKESIVINNDLVLGNIITDSLSTQSLIDESNGQELSHKIIDELIELDLELNEMHKSMDQIINLLTHSLKTSGEQVVTALYTFKSVDFECMPEDNCLIGRLNTQTLNNENVVNLAEDVIDLNINHLINNSIHFENLRFDKDLKLKGLINGLNTTEVVTKHSDHDIFARKTFTNSVNANEVKVKHLINDKVISRSTVFLTNSDQFINNSIKFIDNIEVSSLRVNGHINNINIEQFYNEVVTKDRNRVITGHKSFNELQINELNQSPSNTIDGVDIMKIWNNVLWTFGDQEIVSQINFTDITIGGNLFVNGFINGIKIPNNVLLTNQKAVITGSKLFSTNIKANNIQILNSINGISFMMNNELDLMIKSKNQRVFGQKVFNQIHLGSHSLVLGTVDGVEVSQLKRMLLYRNSSQHFNSLQINGNAYFDGGMNLKDSISGFKIEDLYHKTLKLSDTNIPSFPHLKLDFTQIKSIKCHSINGKNIGIDFMTKHTAQHIYGEKVFANGFKMDEDFIVKSINGKDFNFLINDTLLHENQQYISGEKTFLGDLWVKRLIVNNINNISMNDIVVLNRDQTITAPKIFKDIKVLSDVNVNNLDALVINGVQMKELYENRLLYERPQVMSGRLSVESILIPKETNFETKSLNGIDLRQLMSDAVLIDIPQTISGSKIFLSPVTVDHLKFWNNFDKVTDYDIKHNWLLQDSIQTINGNIIFNNKLRVNDNIFMKNAIINNINLNVVNNNTVKVDEQTVILGLNQFKGPVISNGNIQLLGRIQGIDVNRDAITLNGNHFIKGRIHFEKGFEVNEDLYVNGTIDGVVVQQLCDNTVRKNFNQVITGTTIVSGNVLFNGPLSVGSGLNGINIEGFNRSVVKTDESANMRGIKKFKTLVINGPVIVINSMDGIHIDYLFDKYMSLSRDQIVNSKLVFMNDFNINKNVLVKGSLKTQNGLINGINLSQLDSNVMKTYGNQIISGEFTFENDIHFGQQLNIVNKKLNNININKDLMIRGRNNVITVPKIFAQNINVDNNLEINDRKTIADFDISEMVKYSVMKTNGKYNISGEKHFRSLKVDNLKVGFINGIEMSDRSLLLSYGNQRIIGSKIINNNLTVNSEIKANKINDINIPQLSESLVLKGNNNTITSMKTFYSPLTVHNVHAFGKVDSVDVNELNYFIGLPIDLLDLRIRLAVEDKKIVSLERALEGQAIDLAYYQLVLSLSSGPSLLAFHNFDTNSEHLFISGQYLDNGCQEILIYEHLNNNGFQLKGKFYAIDANSMITFAHFGHQFLMISNSRRTSIPDCLKQNPSTHLFHYGSGPSITQVFKWDKSHNNYQQMAFIFSETVFDIKVIEDQSITPCFVFAIPIVNGFFGKSVIICLDKNSNFVLKEELSLSGIDQISILRSSVFNTTLLASTNSWQTTLSSNKIIINNWSQELRLFDDAIQSIPFLNPSAIHLTESPRDLSAFLFASEKKTSLTHNPLVRIFRYNHKQMVSFIEVQQFKDSEVLSISSTLFENKYLLVFMLINDRIDSFQLKGSSGFVKVNQIDAQNANSFIVFNNFETNGKPDGHFISIAFEKGCHSRHKYLCRYENHILKSKINGKHPLIH